MENPLIGNQRGKLTTRLKWFSVISLDEATDLVELAVGWLIESRMNCCDGCIIYNFPVCRYEDSPWDNPFKRGVYGLKRCGNWKGSYFITSPLQRPLYHSALMVNLRQVLCQLNDDRAILSSQDSFNSSLTRTTMTKTIGLISILVDMEPATW